MSACIFFLSMIGCATLTKVDPQSGLQVNYTGPARGAADLVRATDARPYLLAETAVKKGISITLHHGDTRLTTGVFQEEVGESAGGYAAPTVTYDGRGFVRTGRSGGLPPLAPARTVVGSANQSSSGDPIVECPKDRAPKTVAEQAACAMLIGETLVQERERR
ncbi:hypothetical protein HYV70_02755 [Candidatus Uhrbacteria bacterium]|nr:hypothetical protein [Candidatus Uhrbacteria bacterium]